MGASPLPWPGPSLGSLSSALPPPLPLRITEAGARAFGKWKPLILSMGSEEGLQGLGWSSQPGSPTLGQDVLASNSPTITPHDKPAPPPTAQTVLQVWSKKQEEQTARPNNVDGFCPYHRSLARVQRGLPLVPWSTPHAGESVLSGRSAPPASFLHAPSVSCTPGRPPFQPHLRLLCSLSLWPQQPRGSLWVAVSSLLSPVGEPPGEQQPGPSPLGPRSTIFSSKLFVC